MMANYQPISSLELLHTHLHSLVKKQKDKQTKKQQQSLILPLCCLATKAGSGAVYIMIHDCILMPSWG